MMSYPILIIGGGPAGASAAIFLSRAGFEVHLADMNSPWDEVALPKVGENLPPNAHGILGELGMLDSLKKYDHLKTLGNQSVWGSPKLAYHDFLREPYAFGWHLDRRKFEQALWYKAGEEGAIEFKHTKVKAATFDKGKWEVELLSRHEGSIRATYAFLVDASGKNSWLARRMGMDRLFVDRQLALVAFLKAEKEVPISSSLVETHPQGWWYAAKIPGKCIATAFVCKPSPQERQQWTQKDLWWDLMSETTFISQRMEGAAAQLMEKPFFVSAETSILHKTYGPGWMAIGDAALSYDPMASHGMLMGMLAARDLSRALVSFLNGHADAPEIYDQRLRKAFFAYIKQRQAIYQSEKRYPASTYWRSFSSEVNPG